MLKVSLNLVAVAAMLFGIVRPGHFIEVDSLNSPTAKPIPDGSDEVGSNEDHFKGRGRFSVPLLLRPRLGTPTSAVDLLVQHENLPDDATWITAT